MNTPVTFDSRASDRLVALSIRHLEKRFEAVSANLANVETPGYKRLMTQGETFALALERSQQSGATGQIRHVRTFDQGALQHTDHAQDLALQGNGMFSVEWNGQLAFTRSVSLRADPEGYLADQRGARLIGQGGPIRLQGSLLDLKVEPDGSLQMEGASVDKLRIVEFEDHQHLGDMGGGMFAGDKATAEAATETVVLTGQRERSNVDTLQELVEMIAIHRQHQAAQKALSTNTQMRERLFQAIA